MEIALAGPEHLDPAYVARYDRKAAVDPGADLALLQERGLDATSTLVDLGAGTGTFALAAARETGRVIAVDPSAAMLAALEAKVSDSGISNIECVQAGFLTYEHTGDLADFVYSRHALHHLPDFWKAIALQRVFGVLRPGGVLLLRDLVFGFEPSDAEARIDAWFDNAAERADEGWTREELETHLRTEYSTFSWLLEPMIEHAGFSIVQKELDTLEIFASYVCEKPAH
jgi:ubiquinone/menaquinone biosynthesis C-methylase UbiE